MISLRLTKAECISRLLKRRVAQQSFTAVTRRNGSFKSGKVEEDVEDVDRPIKYSTSEAAQWQAMHTCKPIRDRPESESWVLSLSLIVFMIYFFILREENDIDEMLNMPLQDQLLQLQAYMDTQKQQSKVK